MSKIVINTDETNKNIPVLTTKILDDLGHGHNFVMSPGALSLLLQAYTQMSDSVEECDELMNLFSFKKDLSDVTDSLSYKLVAALDEKKVYDFATVPWLTDAKYRDMAYKTPYDFADPGFALSPANYRTGTTWGTTMFPAPITTDTIMALAVHPNYKQGDFDANKNLFCHWGDKEFLSDSGLIKTFHNIGLVGEHNYYESDDAYAMKLFYYTREERCPDSLFIILPKPDVNLHDVNIMDFLCGRCKLRTPDMLKLQMPQIDITSHWVFDETTAKYFGLKHFGEGGISKNIYAGGCTKVLMGQGLHFKTYTTGVSDVGTVPRVDGKPSRLVIRPSLRSKFDFICDRPFAFVLMDGSDNTPVYFGQFTGEE